MKLAPLPADEPHRLAALKRYDILDTEPEVAYDEIAVLASQICGTPIAMVCLVDADRQWFKAKVGVSHQGGPRDTSFCAHTILGTQLLVVPDTFADERFADNPLVTSDPCIRFYAGAPLVTPDGAALGTLCTIDHVPHETGGMPLRSARVGLDDLLAEVVSLFAATTAQKAIGISLTPDPAAVVEADPWMLHSTVQNLLSNAIKFTPAGGSVHLSTRVRDHDVELTVADTGIGMSAEQLDKLFHIETWFTTPGTAGETGSGLGLLLCRQLVEKNQGTLTVASQPGRGTTFVLSLPRSLKNSSVGEPFE